VLVADTLCNEVKKNGFAICEDVLSPEEIATLLDALGRIGESGSLQRRGATFAIRNILDTSLEVWELAKSDVVRRLVGAVLGPVVPPSQIFRCTVGCLRLKFGRCLRPLIRPLSLPFENTSG
jgi:hypothetical protein